MRKAGSNVVKGVIILTMAGFLVRIIGFLYRLPLTYLIGDDGNGIYGAGYQIYNFFFTISTTGIPIAISKMVSERVALNREYEAYRVFKISIYIMFFIGVGFALILGFGARLFSHILNYDRAYYTMVALAPTLAFTGVISAYRGYFQGMGDMTPTAISQIVEQIVKAIGAVALAYIIIRMGKSVQLSAAGATFGTTLGAFAALISLVYIYKNRSKKRKVLLTKKMESASSIFKTIIRLAIPIAIGASVITAANLIDLFMIKWRLLSVGFSEVRASQLYGILTGKVVTILNLPTVITAAMAAVVVPSISAQAVKRNKNDNINEKIKTVIRLTMLVIMPAAVGLSALSDPIIKMLFPTQPEGGYILAIGSYYLIFLALSQNITAVIQALGKPEIPAINLCIGIFIKVVLNYFLIGIPSINILGTQISSIVCYFITFILNYHSLKRMINFKFPLFKGLLIPCLGSCVMFVTVIISYGKLTTHFSLAISTIISILIGMIAYLFSITLIGGIEKSDVELVCGRKITVK